MQLRLPLQMNRVDPRLTTEAEPAADPELDVAADRDPAPGTARARRGRRLPWALVLGVLLLGGAAVVVFLSAPGGKVPAAAPVAETMAPPVAAPPAAETAAPDSFAATAGRALEIEAVGADRVRRFLAARAVDDYAPLVREPEAVLPRIREFLPTNPPRTLALRSMKVSVAPGGRYLAILTLDDFSTRRMILEDTSDGVRIDWEAWVGWSSMPWRKFKETKASVAQEFRVTATPVSYYNYEFADEQRWSAWMLSSPQGDDFLYGYVARDSPVEAKLISLSKRAAGAVTVLLAFQPNATANTMCEITDVVAAGWARQSADASSHPSKP
jgi:hypothetical protein